MCFSRLAIGADENNNLTQAVVYVKARSVASGQQDDAPGGVAVEHARVAVSAGASGPEQGALAVEAAAAHDVNRKFGIVRTCDD